MSGPSEEHISYGDWDNLMKTIHQLLNGDYVVIAGTNAEVHVDRKNHCLLFSAWQVGHRGDWVDFVTGLTVLRVSYKSVIGLEHFDFNGSDNQHAATGIIPSTHVSALLDMAVDYLGRELTWRHDALVAASWLYPTGEVVDEDDATTTTPAPEFNDDIPF